MPKTQCNHPTKLAFRRAPQLPSEDWSANGRQVTALLKSTDDGMYPMLYSECLCKGSRSAFNEYSDFMDQLCSRDPGRAISLHGKVVARMKQDRGSRQNLRAVAALLEKKGRNGDTVLAHITPEEAMHLKDHGGSGTRKPETGLLEFFAGGFNDRGIDDAGPSPSSSNGDWFSGGSSSGFSSAFDSFGDSFSDTFSSSFPPNSSYGDSDSGLDDMKRRREEEEKALEDQRLADEKAAEDKRIADEKAVADQRAADEEARKATELADQQKAEADRQFKLAEQQRSNREQSFFEDDISKPEPQKPKAAVRVLPPKPALKPTGKLWWQSDKVEPADDAAVSANGRAVSALQKTTDNAEHSQWIAKDIAAGNKPAIAKLGNFLQQMEKVDPKRAKQYSDEVMKRLPKKSQDAILKLGSTGGDESTSQSGGEPKWMEQLRQHKLGKIQSSQTPEQLAATVTDAGSDDDEVGTTQTGEATDTLESEPIVNVSALETPQPDQQEISKPKQDAPTEQIWHEDFSIQDEPSDAPATGIQNDAPAQMLLDQKNLQLGMKQGTLPYVTDINGQYLYKPAPDDVQSQMYRSDDAEGIYNPDPSKYVVLHDPADGKHKAWLRTEETNESKAMGLARFAGESALPGVASKIGKGISSLSRTSTPAKNSNLVKKANKAFGGWVDRVMQSNGKATKQAQKVGEITPEIFDFLKTKGIEASSLDILVNDSAIMHMLRDGKAARGAGIPKDLIGRMPGILKNPSAIFWDKQDPALLYVFDIPGDARKGKFVVRVDYATKAKLPGQSKSKSITGNFVRTGGVVDPNNLRAKRYLPITED